jgi:hypothetical protein
MKRIIPFIVVLLSVSFVQGQDLLTSIKDFGGMAVCWERTNAAKTLLVSEQWMKPAGTSMLGMGRTVQDGRTSDYEYMRIEQRDDGIFFVAQPLANSTETSFKMKSLQPGIVIFENLAHDFPQRVIYNFTKTDSLKARIEGRMNGQSRGIDFPFVRTKCG